MDIIKGLGGAACLAIGAAGCAAGEVGDKSADTGVDGAAGDIELDEAPSSSDAPVLLEATVYQSGSKCFLEATYSDPQGPADVRRGSVRAVDPATGSVYWSDDLFVCIDNGCIGSFDDSHTQYSAAPCNRLDSYALHGLVYDRSGLESNERVLARE